MDSSYLILGTILLVLIAVIAYRDKKRKPPADSGVRGDKFAQPPKQKE